MSIIKIVSTREFIQKLTLNRLSEKQLNRAVASLRANGISFYDDWSREHCSILNTLETEKAKVINALRATLEIN